MINCDNVTNIRRSLPAGATLLMGDQIVSGCAIKVSHSAKKKSQTDEQIAQNIAVAEIYGLSEEDLNSDPLVKTPIGTKLHAPQSFFITEPGWEVCEPGAEVIHSGYGGEVRSFGAGSDLLPGDLVVNGTAVDPDGVTHDAPLSIGVSGWNVGPDGAVVSPASDDDESGFCSLQELAGRGRADSSPVSKLIPELELDFEIPGLDLSWWVPIQEKIVEITQLHTKLAARVQSLQIKIDSDPDGDACKFRPQAQQLLRLIRDVQRIITQIRKVVQAVRTAVNTVKRVIKIIESIFMIGKAVKMAFVYFTIKQMVLGLAQMIDTLARSLLDANRVLPQLIAMLAAMIQACANQRGLEDGLTKEDCEALGGTWITGRSGDMGDASDGGIGDGGLTADVNDFIGSLSDEGDLYLRPGLELNEGDVIKSGCVESPTGDKVHAPEIFTIPSSGWVVCEEGASGESDNATISQEEINAILNSQLVDLSECLTRIDDIEKTFNYSN